MKKAAIFKTAICYWSDDDDCYVVASPLFLRTAGVGQTEQKAWMHFEQMLDDIYPDLAAGEIAGYEKPGRPSKGGVDLHAQVKPDTKKEIAQLAQDLGISQGEAVDYLLFFHSVRKDNKPAKNSSKISYAELLSGESYSGVVAEPLLQDLDNRLKRIERLVTRKKSQGGKKT